ncbi:hypothetical protein VP01_285g2 [Puccinia sorghi]|uniref:Uncharacterized protein n=1 Tax=Puccinia sorghi TaxID=27349 RepID=A0A0L6V3P0_9BASI|nr:hypothetical protein VP01_285g2 [Puccinia sorghi]
MSTAGIDLGRVLGAGKDWGGLHVEPTRPEGHKKSEKTDELNIGDPIKGQKELLKISHQKQKSFDGFLDDLVMSKYISGMDQENCQYFQAKR